MNASKLVLASTRTGYAFKPRQCDKCRLLFEPKTEMQTTCRKCQKGMEQPSYITKTPRQCKYPGCTETFLPRGNRQVYCDKHKNNKKSKTGVKPTSVVHTQSAVAVSSIKSTPALFEWLGLRGLRGTLPHDVNRVIVEGEKVRIIVEPL